MTVSLTYDATLSRVRIAATSLPTGVDTVTVERSTNQITWTVVRGGSAVAVVSSAASLDDYEFAPDVVNYYRVTTVDADPITYIGTGAAATGNNTSVSPALPVGWIAGDLALILASIRNSGTGTVNTPTGWTAVAASGNVALLGRRLQSGDVAPTVTFAGGAANADTIARCAVWRNADLSAVTATQLSGSAQNIAYPALTLSSAGRLVIAAGWKQDDWTSVAGAFGTEIAESISTAGDDSGQVWNYSIQTTASNITAGSFTVTGGVSAISRGIVAAFAPAPYRTRETNSITATLDAVWLKSIVRPFLNLPVDVRSYSEIERPSRVGVFSVIGRSYPVAVTDVPDSRRWTLQLRCETAEQARDLELLLASGDPLFVHVPTAVDLISTTPGGYIVAGDTTTWRLAAHLPIVIVEIPCTEVAPPGPDVVGATVTWRSVMNTYGTWADLMAAQATWADLLETIGEPGDVVVP